MTDTATDRTAAATPARARTSAGRLGVIVAALAGLLLTNLAI
jgi:hypothetical protein